MAQRIGSKWWLGGRGGSIEEGMVVGREREGRNEIVNWKVQSERWEVAARCRQSLRHVAVLEQCNTHLPITYLKQATNEVDLI